MNAVVVVGDGGGCGGGGSSGGGGGGGGLVLLLRICRIYFLRQDKRDPHHINRTKSRKGKEG